MEKIKNQKEPAERQKRDFGPKIGQVNAELQGGK